MRPAKQNFACANQVAPRRKVVQDESRGLWRALVRRRVSLQQHLIVDRVGQAVTTSNVIHAETGITDHTPGVHDVTGNRCRRMGIAIGGPSAGPRFMHYEDRVEAFGNSDAAALASKVDKIENALRTSATGANDGGGAYKTNIIAALDAGSPWGSSASQKLKVGG